MPKRNNRFLQEGSISAPGERVRLCLDAAGELKALITMIQRCIQESEPGPLHWQTRAILARSRQLCDTLQDALDDETVKTEDIAAVLSLSSGR